MSETADLQTGQLQARLEAMRSQFARRCLSQVEDLEVLVQVGADGPVIVDRDALQKFAHSFAGAGGIFGFPDVSHHGAALEDVLQGPATDAVVRQAVIRTVADLRVALAGATVTQRSSDPGKR